jgi:hypothetical protein
VEKPTCFTRKYTAVPMASMTYNMKLGDFHTILFRGASHPVSSNRSFPELSCLLMVLGLFDSGSALAIATAENSAEGAREGDAACGSRHGARRRSSRRATRKARLGAKVSGQRPCRRGLGATRDGARSRRVGSSFDF